MKKFIKFTNVTPFDLFGKSQCVIEELIVSTDRISSISKTGDRFTLFIKSVIVEKADEGGYKITPDSQAALISKEDYEYAKSLLLDNDQSITPTDGNNAGPAIETLENDADPATKEKELLKRVMDEFNNNIVGASMRLGMSVNVLRRKLKSYGLLPCE